MAREPIEYRWVTVNDLPRAYVLHQDGLTVCGGQDPVSRQPTPKGTAQWTITSRNRKRTLLARGSDFWFVWGWLSPAESVAAIVNR